MDGAAWRRAAGSLLQLQTELRRIALARCWPYDAAAQQGTCCRSPTTSAARALLLKRSELPMLRMLAPLLNARPLLVEGRLLDRDGPGPCSHHRSFVSNWLVRTARADQCQDAGLLRATGTELAPLLLVQELLATRSLSGCAHSSMPVKLGASVFEDDDV